MINNGNQHYSIRTVHTKRARSQARREPQADWGPKTFISAFDWSVLIIYWESSDLLDVDVLLNHNAVSHMEAFIHLFSPLFRLTWVPTFVHPFCFFSQTKREFSDFRYYSLSLILFVDFILCCFSFPFFVSLSSIVDKKGIQIPLLGEIWTALHNVDFTYF